MISEADVQARWAEQRRVCAGRGRGRCGNAGQTISMFSVSCIWCWTPGLWISGCSCRALLARVRSVRRFAFEVAQYVPTTVTRCVILCLVRVLTRDISLVFMLREFLTCSNRPRLGAASSSAGEATIKVRRQLEQLRRRLNECCRENRCVFDLPRGAKVCGG